VLTVKSQTKLTYADESIRKSDVVDCWEWDGEDDDGQGDRYSVGGG
jgi:hypothetical protein